MLTVHTRLREERPRDPAHWDRLAPVVSALSIPVCMNGDVMKYEDIEKCKEETGCSSVMIARAAQWNPSVFRSEGFLPMETVMSDYLKTSVVYDYHFKNTKYVLAQMMEGAQRTKGPYQDQYQSLSRSKSHLDMCKVFDVNTSWYEERKGETLGGLLQDTKLIKKKRKAEHQEAKLAKEAKISLEMEMAAGEKVACEKEAGEVIVGDCDGAVPNEKRDVKYST